jgi:hypothetical protein
MEHPRTQIATCRKRIDARDWSTNSFPLPVAKPFGMIPADRKMTSPLISLLKRNEALAREIGRVKEVNRRQAENIKELVAQLLLLDRKPKVSQATQTDFCHTVTDKKTCFVTGTPKSYRSTFKLLARLSSSGNLDELTDWNPSGISSPPIPQLADFFPSRLGVESPYLLSRPHSNSPIEINLRIKCRDSPTARRLSRTSAKNVVSYREPSLKVKVRKGFEFFKKTIDGNTDGTTGAPF